MKKISVIVLAYQVEQYLEQCISSILNQVYQNLELILVDDGSPDRCGEICDAFAQRDNRIRVIHQENRGVAAAREVGVAMSTGELIGFVDGDDFIDPMFYQMLAAYMEKTGKDIAECYSWDYREGDRIRTYKKEEPVTCTVRTPEAWLTETNLGEFLSCVLWNKLYARKVFEGAVFPTGRRSNEDESVVYQLVYNSNGICRISPKLYAYRHRAESLTGRKLFFREAVEKIAALSEKVDFFDGYGEEKISNFSRAKLCICALSLLKLAKEQEWPRNCETEWYQLAAKEFKVIWNDSAVPLKFRGYIAVELLLHKFNR